MEQVPSLNKMENRVCKLLYISKRFLNWIRCFTGSQCKLLQAQLVDEKRGSLQIIRQIIFWMPWRRLRSLTRYTGQKWVTVMESARNQGISQCNSSWFTQMTLNSGKITYVVETGFPYKIYLSRKGKTWIKNNTKITNFICWG